MNEYPEEHKYWDKDKYEPRCVYVTWLENKIKELELKVQTFAALGSSMLNQLTDEEADRIIDAIDEEPLSAEAYEIADRVIASCKPLTDERKETIKSAVTIAAGLFQAGNMNRMEFEEHMVDYILKTCEKVSNEVSRRRADQETGS